MKRILSLLVALAMTAAMLPAANAFAVQAQDAHPTPEGYNDHDYQKLLAFLEYADPNGVKNGSKLSPNYDPADPSTWGGEPSFEDYLGLTWTQGNDKRLTSFGCEAGVFNRVYGVLDLSGCTELTHLWCADNSIWGVNVSGCEKLELLSCGENALSSGLHIEGCVSLSELYCEYCDLTELDLSGLASLTVLYVAGNYMTELDFSGCLALEQIEIFYMDLTSINVSGLPALQRLEVSGCPLNTFEIRDCPSLETVVLEADGLTQLDIENCPAVGHLILGYNPLAELDVSQLAELRSLDCHGNSITQIDVANNPLLERLSLDFTYVSSIDVSQNPLLRSLSCSYTSIRELDVTNNPLLSTLNCFGNSIKQLDLTNNPLIPYESITTRGSGYIGVGREEEEAGPFGAVATAAGEAAFMGWYDEQGELISSDTVLWADGEEFGRVVAKFVSSVLPGDANGDGAVDSADALLVMRYSMGLASIDPAYLASCDMNGDGAVDSADALLLMRTAMGL